MPLSQELKSSKNEGKWDRVSERLQQNVGLSNILYMKELRARIVNWFTQGYTNAMATHSSVLAWKIPWTEEAGRLQSMGVTKSRARLSDFTFTFHFQALEKEMATHSSILAWRIPGTEEPNGLPSMGSHRVRHDWGDLAVAAAATLI